MNKSTCPWWLGYLLINPIRRLFQNPSKIIGPYIREGMTVLEVGPGMGFFTLDLAAKAGKTGHVIAVDVQSKMLDKLKKRADHAQLSEQIEIRLCQSNSLGISDKVGKIDFVFALAVVHELPDTNMFWHEVAQALKPGGRLLIAEPKGHVSSEEFDAELSIAFQNGFEIVERKEKHFAIIEKPIEALGNINRLK